MAKILVFVLALTAVKRLMEPEEYLVAGNGIIQCSRGEESLWQIAGMDGIWTPEAQKRKVRKKNTRKLERTKKRIIIGRRRRGSAAWCITGCLWTGLIWGAAGQPLDALEGSWWMRKSIESEVLAAVTLVTTIVQQLEALECLPWEKGRHRRLYIAAGRALRLADATQNYLMNINEKRRSCVTCSRNPKS
jgi:hypothetical protein